MSNYLVANYNPLNWATGAAGSGELRGTAQIIKILRGTVQIRKASRGTVQISKVQRGTAQITKTV